jgi:hypothetical protein
MRFDGVAHFVRASVAAISASKIYGNRFEGGLLFARRCVMMLMGCVFRDNKGIIGVTESGRLFRVSGCIFFDGVSRHLAGRELRGRRSRPVIGGVASVVCLVVVALCCDHKKSPEEPSDSAVVVESLSHAFQGVASENVLWAANLWCVDGDETPITSGGSFPGEASGSA